MTTSSRNAFTRRRFLAGSAALLASGAARAGNPWPDGRPITWVVPYPPGGSTDVLGRDIAKELDVLLSTSVIVQNKPGATGTIGAAFVARAEPDGLTLLATSIGPQAIAPHMMGKLPYDPITSFAPIITAGTIPHILVVNAHEPYRSVQDLVNAGLAAPGRIAFASGGTGTILQMQAELLQQQTGAKFLHVPYKGDTPALQDTLGGQVQFMFAPVAAALPHIQSGALRALAVTSAKRLPMLPAIPTMTEEGFKDFVVEQWQAIFAPAGTPTPIITRMNAAIEQTLKQPSVQTFAAQVGITLTGGTPQQLDALRRADYMKWGKVIRAAGIKA